MRRRARTRAQQLMRCTVPFCVLLAIGCSPPDDGRPIPASDDAVRDSEGPRARRVILISLDTLRADRLGFLGNERDTSPMLDALAREGVIFEDASAASTWTLPSHASMLTGLSARSHRVIDRRSALPSAIPTLATNLGRQGFVTAAAVNTIFLKASGFKISKDFDEYLYVPENTARRSPSTWITDQAIEWLKQFADQRLFLFLHYYDTHSDYASLPEYEKLYRSDYDGEADGSTWQLATSNLHPTFIQSCREDFDAKRCVVTQGRPVDGSLSRARFEEADVAHLLDLYDASIRQIDAELGRLFSFLREAGLMDDAIVIVTSDHGEEFMDHGAMQHGLRPYQEVLRVPLLIRGPGIPADLRSEVPVSIIDIAPTILTQVGASPSRPMEGLDLTTLWAGGDDSPFRDRYIFGEAPGWTGETIGHFFVESIRRDRYKLLYDSHTGDRELYDLEADPLERVEIGEREPGLRDHLLRQLMARQSVSIEDDLLILDKEDLEHLEALGYFQ